MSAKVRLTPGQLSLLTGAKPKFGERPRPPAPKKRREDLPENQVEAQIVDFLRAKGWHVIRQQVGTYVPYRVLAEARSGKTPNVIPIRIGEKGMCDWKASRALEPWMTIRPSGASRLGNAAKELIARHEFEFEVKAPGRRPNPDQLEYIRRAIALKRNAFWWSSYDAFREAYRNLTGE